jgi:probable phosphoglycerate mutase
MPGLSRKPPDFLSFRRAARYSSGFTPALKDFPLQVTRILAVRHGETAWNRDTRIQGHTDIALNEHGRWQASQLATALRDEPIAAVYASDLGRAFETAQAVARVKGLEVTPHKGLRERHFGRFEGQTWAELELRWPTEALAWRKRMPDFAPAGGESLEQLQRRVIPTVLELASRHPGEQVLMVAHGGVMDMLYRAATRLELNAPRSWELPNTAINRLLWSPEGLSLVGWADTTHLQTGAPLDERSV